MGPLDAVGLVWLILVGLVMGAALGALVPPLHELILIAIFGGLPWLLLRAVQPRRWRQ